jgi:hypothetical protein
MGEIKNIEDIPHLLRREVEARLLKNLLPALEKAFGKEKLRHVLGETIAQCAMQEGVACAERFGGNSLEKLTHVIDLWREGNALEISVLQQDSQHLAFNVMRCAYAELYERLGMRDLGTTLSCQRDFAFIKGFNPNIRLTREHTLMEGHCCCDFRYEVEDLENRQEQ